VFKRIVSVVLCAVLLLETSACHSTRRRAVEPQAVAMERQQGEWIIALTMKSGTVIEFQRASRRGNLVAAVRPWIANDSAYAILKDSTRFAAPLSDVERVWLARRSGNTLGTIGAVVGVVAGVLLVAAIIVAATKESCPFVYSWDGAQFVFDAEPYGGAVTAGLERDDYAELENLRAVDGAYRIRVTNEVNETQFTNLFEIWAVDHPTGTRAVADEWGGIHTLESPLPPTAVRDADGRDLLSWLEQTDRRIWEPMAERRAGGAVRQDIVLSFPKPEGATTAKLVANVATGLWGSHMIREMLELRGTAIDDWYAAIDGDSVVLDSLMQWNYREELYLLKLYVEEPSGWEVRGMLPGGGPFIAEDRVVPLDVSRVPGDELRVRIRPPLGFWALNSFAVDYSSDAEVRVTPTSLMAAQDHRGRDVRALLVAADDQYHEMPALGDWADVTFPAVSDPQPGLTRTMFLHSRGYYRLHLSQDGTPQTALIDEFFRTPDAAAVYAVERYGAWQEAASR